ncbi:hypothetical protein JN535_19115 [Cellulosimicrobium cellulans]|uniref:hypothetical protein n=1 Tax=Cellulosimicrobium cellulans TaxID=1710 RepID=UPI001964A65F|nr:hypothetical protein [Cellulosimicrobium cellulans]MBN0042265.1 hypothetical protein [Cellulosimicrobium cellulans]
MKPSQRYTADAELLLAFRTAYIDLVNSSRVSSDGLFKILVPDVPHPQYQDKRRKVALAAGPAALAYSRYGGTYTLRNAAVINHHVNPVANWEMSLRRPEDLTPDMILNSLEGALGSAHQEALEAEQRERGLTGLIAAFLRWPANLREAVGSGNRAQRTAAGAIGIVGQIIVATLATALGTALVAGVAALWRSFL